MKEKIKDNALWEKVYLIILGIYLTIDVLNTTMFNIKWPSRIGYVQFAMIGAYTICKLICFTYLKKYKWYELTFSIIIIVLFTIPAVFTTSYSYLFGIAFLIVGAKDVDFYKILKVYIAVVVIIMSAAFVASMTGIIENLQITDPNKGIRNSFGSIYPTDFGAHIFYLFGAWACLRDKIIKWPELVVMLIIVSVVFIFSKPVTSTACIAILIVLCITNKYTGGTSFPDKICVYSTAIFAGAYLLMQKIYDPLNIYWSEFDHKISLRLYYTYQILQKYSMKLFGQDIKENGYGGKHKLTEDYMFLDDSYMAIAMKYGVVILIITLFILCIGQKRALDAKKRIIIYVGGIIALHSFMEHHLLEVAYNPLLLLIFANINKTAVEARKEKI